MLEAPVGALKHSEFHCQSADPELNPAQIIFKLLYTSESHLKFIDLPILSIILLRIVNFNEVLF